MKIIIIIINLHTLPRATDPNERRKHRQDERQRAHRRAREPRRRRDSTMDDTERQPKRTRTNEMAKAIFFDLDDTLVQTSDADQIAYDAVKRLLERRLDAAVDVEACVESYKRGVKKTPWDTRTRASEEDAETSSECVDVDEVMSSKAPIHVWSWRRALWKRALEESVSLDDANARGKLDYYAYVANDTFRDVRLHALEISRTVRDEIEALKRAGVVVGVITNGDPVIQREKLAACGAYELFPNELILVGGEEILAGREEKPGRGVFERALALAGALADRTVFMGDNWNADIVGASAAGYAGAVWIKRDDDKDDADERSVVDAFQNGTPPKDFLFIRANSVVDACRDVRLEAWVANR